MDHTDISPNPARLISLGMLAFFTMLGLKIFEVIHCSWWYVVLPLLLPLIVIVYISVALWRTFFSKRKKPTARKKIPDWLYR